MSDTLPSGKVSWDSLFLNFHIHSTQSGRFCENPLPNLKVTTDFNGTSSGASIIPSTPIRFMENLNSSFMSPSGIRYVAMLSLFSRSILTTGLFIPWFRFSVYPFYPSMANLRADPDPLKRDWTPQEFIIEPVTIDLYILSTINLRQGDLSYSGTRLWNSGRR